MPTLKPAGNSSRAPLLFLLAALPTNAQDELWYAGSKFDLDAGLTRFELADFDGDGRADLLTTFTSVTVRFSEEGGVPGPAEDIGSGSGPFELAVVDLDGDGDLDVAATDLFDSAAHVLLNDGQGSFQQTDVPASPAPRITCGDFDGDGIPDLALGTLIEGDVKVHLGDGLGGFARSIDSPLAPFSTIAWLEASDLDRDGFLDIVVSDSNISTLQSLRGDGTGALGPPKVLSITGSVGEGSVGDIDQDGANDVLLEAGSLVQAFEGDGTGCFAPGQVVSLPASGVPLLFDADSDGLLDLFVTSSLTGSVAFSSGDGRGGFQLEREIELGFQPVGARFGDVDGDGALDIVALDPGWDDVTIVRGSGGAAWETYVDVPAGEGPTQLATGDLDEDGFEDLVTANAVSGNVSVLLQDGTGGFADALNLPMPGTPVDIVVADTSERGILDLVVATTDRIDVRLGDGSGSFPQLKSFPTATGVEALAVGDLDADGLSDMVTVHPATNEIHVKTNDDAAAVPYPVGAEPADVALADLDGDLDLDVVVSASGSSEVWLFPGDESATLGTPVVLGVGAGPRGLALGDLNADGLLDLVTADFDDDALSVLLGDGQGGFGPRTTVSVLDSNLAFGPVDVAIADVDRDGTQDLVSDLETIVLVHPGIGDGTFARPVRFASSYDHLDLHLADFDANGDPDFAFAADERNAATILYHRGVSGAATPYGTLGINPSGSLVLSGAPPVTGTSFELRLDNPLGTQTVGSVPFLVLSLAPDPAFPAGTLLTGFGMALLPGDLGELLISLDAADLLGPPRPGPAWQGAGSPSPFFVPVPDDPSLVGLRVYAQGLLLDATPAATKRFGLTEGLELLIGSR